MNQANDVGESTEPSRSQVRVGSRRLVNVVLWIFTLTTAGYFLHHGWVWFRNPPNLPEEQQRADGNNGHTQIDFGGQWVMGRMVVLGHGRELYHRQRQWQVVRASFPIADEAPANRYGLTDPSLFEDIFGLSRNDHAHDADNLMSWFMGRDPADWSQVGGAAVAPLMADPFGNPLLTAALLQASAESVSPEIVKAVESPAIGGPLYPPVHAFLYAPIGMIERPLIAYHAFQVFSVLMVLVAGLGVKVLSGGRIPWSVATLVLLLFPGTRGGLDLGQNPSLTLAIVIWGWALASRGYQVGGGMVWGLLAFKPVWGLAFFLVPVLTRRWRFCVAMVLTGCGLAAATLPFVGYQTWLDWLAVGREAAALYNVNFNWIHLSRDVQSIPRRILHDFTLHEPERDQPLTKTLAWALWGIILGVTAAVFLRYGDRRRWTGIGIAFLFFGAYLTCYRFMYYDALLIAIGCAVLFAEPSRFFRPRVFDPTPTQLSVLPPPTREIVAPWQVPNFLGPRMLGYVCSLPLTVLALLLLYENCLSGMDFRATLGVGYFGEVTIGPDGNTGRVTPRFQVDTGVNYPWETALAFILWVWCGWKLMNGVERTRSESVPSDRPL